jgi:membrane-associated protein
VFDWLTQVQASPLTYLAVFGACAHDAALSIVPSEAVVIAASVLAARASCPFGWLLWPPRLAGSSATPAPMCLVAPPGPRPLDGCFAAPKAKGRLTWAGEALDRHGATIIMVARFVPGGRTATTFTAGTVRLAWPRFAAADAVGASLWAAYAGGLGYLGNEER